MPILDSDPNYSYRTINKGLLLANVAGAIVVAGCKYILGPDQDGAGSLVMSIFIITPFMMGLISAYVWRELNLKQKQILGWALVNTIIAIMASAVFLQEGAICLLIVSPL